MNLLIKMWSFSLMFFLSSSCIASEPEMHLDQGVELCNGIFNHQIHDSERLQRKDRCDAIRLQIIRAAQLRPSNFVDGHVVCGNEALAKMTDGKDLSCKLVLNRDGDIKISEISKSSGSTNLDRQVLNLIQHVSTYKPSLESENLAYQIDFPSVKVSELNN